MNSLRNLFGCRRPNMTTMDGIPIVSKKWSTGKKIAVTFGVIMGILLISALAFGLYAKFGHTLALNQMVDHQILPLMHKFASLMQSHVAAWSIPVSFIGGALIVGAIAYQVGYRNGHKRAYTLE